MSSLEQLPELQPPHQHGVLRVPASLCHWFLGKPGEGHLTDGDKSGALIVVRGRVGEGASGIVSVRSRKWAYKEYGVTHA